MPGRRSSATTPTARRSCSARARAHAHVHRPTAARWAGGWWTVSHTISGRDTASSAARAPTAELHDGRRGRGRYLYLPRKKGTSHCSDRRVPHPHRLWLACCAWLRATRWAPSCRVTTAAKAGDRPRRSTPTSRRPRQHDHTQRGLQGRHTIVMHVVGDATENTVIKEAVSTAKAIGTLSCHWSTSMKAYKVEQRC